MSNDSNENDRPMVLYATKRGRIINLFLVESFCVPSEFNPKQPYGVYMCSGIFHTLDVEEFDYLMTHYAEVCSRS